MPLEDFLAAIEGIASAQDKPTLRRKSRDFYWYSPILKRQLDPMLAEIVVLPRNTDDIRRIAAAAYRSHFPITVRGGGTGNYGQATPLQGGAILEMTQLNELLWVRDGVARVQAGMNLLALDRALRRDGWEIRMYPSTKRTATIGGHICGGFGGIGSITWGSLTEPGNVLALQIVTVEADPRTIELRGRDCNLSNHTFGTTGIVCEVEIAVQPAVRWRDVAVAFPTLETTLRFALEVAGAPGIDKKLCTVVEARLTPFFKRMLDILLPGHATALLMLAPEAIAPVREMAARHGMSVFVDEDTLQAEDDPERTPLYEFTWNHTTLQVLKQDRSVTYLQCMFPADHLLDTILEMHALLQDEVMLHVEFIRVGARITCSALPVLRYTTEDRLNEMIALHEARGVMISNPHVYTLEDGSRYKLVAADQRGFKHQVDPRGLLNPGKMRTFPPPTKD